jgi:hypothetical protein
MGDKAIKTKAELYAMLAEAIRNTQPQPVRDPQPEPQPKTQPKTQLAPKRETRSRKTRPTLKRTAKIKKVRR